MTRDPATKRLNDQAYYARNKDALNKLARDRRAAGYYEKYDLSRTARPEYIKGRFLQKKYGITLEQWWEIFERQGRRCGACRSATPKRVGRRAGWATDHDHRTGQIRGILCNACNVALGWLGDTIENVQASSADLLDYLRSGVNVGTCKAIDLNGPSPLPTTCPRKTGPIQYHYTIVRADLPHGLQMAQTVHAAGESASPRPKPGTHAVALHAKDEAHIREIAQRLFDAGIEHHCVFECDDDPDYPGQLMSIGLYPRTGKCKEISDLPLVK